MATFRQQAIEWWANRSDQEKWVMINVTEKLVGRSLETLTGREIQLLWVEYGSIKCYPRRKS